MNKKEKKKRFIVVEMILSLSMKTAERIITLFMPNIVKVKAKGQSAKQVRFINEL